MAYYSHAELRTLQISDNYALACILLAVAAILNSVMTYLPGERRVNGERRFLVQDGQRFVEYRHAQIVYSRVESSRATGRLWIPAATLASAHSYVVVIAMQQAAAPI